MNATLTYEQMMDLFAEGRKETAEIRESIVDMRVAFPKGCAAKAW
jgi:hypothetical protein